VKLRERILQRTFLIALSLFVGGMLAITAYTLWRLRGEALSRGLETSAMHSQSIEDLLTQSLHVTELIAANTLAQAPRPQETRQVVNTFNALLGRSPFLRSMSLLDDSGRIVVSSNPANVGLRVVVDDFLPPAISTTEVMRIGAPWAGRDFASGRPLSEAEPADANTQTFVPVVQTMVSGGRTVRLLVAFNTDYYVNRILRELDIDEGVVEVLLYDGTRLFSSDAAYLPGLKQAYVTQDLRLSEIEFGHFGHVAANGQKMLSSFHASLLYPLLVVTHLDPTYALRHWQREAATLVGFVILILLSISVLAFFYYRRQQLLAAQRAESLRMQRINATVFDSSSEAILITDMHALIISINAAFTQVTGYAPQEIIGRNLLELLTKEGAAAFSEHVLERQLAEQVGRQFESASIEVQLVCADAHLIWTEILSTPERDAQGRVVGFHRICRNISDRKRLEDQIRQLAFIDPLTRLPNRRLFNDRLNQTLAASKRSGFYGALMFIDLDNFKPLNDTHGHAAGDELLVNVAGRLRRCVREIDIVGRFGGDEFVVTLGALSTNPSESKHQAEVIAEKIRSSLSVPYRLVVHKEGAEGAAEQIVTHCCTASIGVVMFSGQGVSQDALLLAADTAMYQAKEAGRNTICFVPG
jgi:diguanylate cyclase (GGDEF)-like protein/PAS domain S-box-containing protein